VDHQGFESLRVEVSDGVAEICFDHPPINLMDAVLIGDLFRLAPRLAADDRVKVVLFRSADPDFFIAHADVTLIQSLPDEDPEDIVEMSAFHKMVESYRTLSKVTIGVVEGIARGGGSEFLLSLDMRFGALGRCLLGQPEVALGILPGGSGTQRLPRLMGRSRALEVVLGCDDFDAATAERYGWINRALPPEELGPFVTRLARRIASFPAGAIALAKQAVHEAEPGFAPGLLYEQRAFAATLRSDAARERMKRFMEAGGQTRDVERDLQVYMESLKG